MAAIQYLIPGGPCINETTDQRQFLVSGGSFVNETSTAPAGEGDFLFGNRLGWFLELSGEMH